MAEFFNMGGYAFFVWTSYAIVAIAFAYAFVSPLIRHRKLLTQIARTSRSEKRVKVVATQTSASASKA